MKLNDQPIDDTQDALQRLILALKILPGIGPKSAQRIAFHLLKLPTPDAERLATAICDAKAKVRFCARCFNVAENDLCGICADVCPEKCIEFVPLRALAADPVLQEELRAEFGDGLGARAQHQMESVAEHNLRTDPLEFFGGHGLHCGLSADRHEYGGLNGTASCLKGSRASGRIRRFQCERAAHRNKVLLSGSGTGAAGVLSLNADLKM